jgi:RNA polymerase sigma-70 factor, ECF subfamily
LDKELRSEAKVELRDAASSSEADLVSRICKGELDLFYDLVRPHQRSVYLVAYSILQNAADAEETAQEALLKAFKSINTFRGDSKFAAWVVSIAANTARMRVRKQRAVLFESLENAREDEDGEYVPKNFSDWREIPSDLLEREEVRAILDKALASLPERYREVIMLRDVQQFSIAETAQTLGIRAGAVKTRLLRARLQMRDLIAPEFCKWAPSRNWFKKGRRPWS